MLEVGETMELSDYLRVPYVAVVYSVETPAGEWIRRAEYPELWGCSAEAPTLREAMEELDRERVRLIRAALESNETIPVPRPPLGGATSGINGTPLSDLLEDRGVDTR